MKCFTAVVCDKQYVLEDALSKRRADQRARYSQNSLYDHLVCKMFANVHYFADEHQLHIAKRGTSNRNVAISKALERRTGVCCTLQSSSGKSVETLICDPIQTARLQAADYFLWAVQRYYEKAVSQVNPRMIVF